MADVTRTNFNVETVVLACEAGDEGRLLQIKLYMSDDGSLQPAYKTSAKLRDNPKAVVEIDGQDFPVLLLFSEGHVVLADAQEGAWPKLSLKLADAMMAGKLMTVRFDLLADTARAAAVNGEAVVNLQAPRATQAIAAVRKCTETGNPNGGGAALRVSLPASHPNF